MMKWRWGVVVLGCMVSFAGGCSGCNKDDSPAATRLGFQPQPTGGVEGVPLAGIQVEIQNAAGVAVAGATHTVTVGLGDNPGSATLLGTTTATAVNGVASFADLVIDAEGVGYTLLATATGLTDGVTTPFDITANLPPQITSSVGNVLDLALHDVASFDVTITDPEGGNVSARLVAVPAGLTFPGIVDEPSGQIVNVQWAIPGAMGRSSIPLIIEAWDDWDTTNRVRFEIRTRVLGASPQGQIATGDVTGDGLPDIVVAARLADVGAVTNAGAVYVFAGGASPTGTPVATLQAPTPTADDLLGSIAPLLVDVTGDGVLDVVTGGRLIDGAAVDSGLIYVWAGGVGLVGTPAPTATLGVPGAAAGDRLGDCSALVPPRVAPILFGDVTGDANEDIVVCARFADQAVTDAGAIYVWEGGAALVGAPVPAVLSVPGAIADDQLGSGGDQPVQLADVTGDGRRDVVALSSLADVGGTVDAGAAYVWAGGNLSGGVSPTATLAVPGAAVGDQLGEMSGISLRFGDATAGPELDLVVGAEPADGAAADSGLVYVWAGGAGLTGNLVPTATLADPGAVAGDQLGNTLGGHGLHLTDVDGDGKTEVIVLSRLADAGATNAGAVYLWKGSATLSGATVPTARLVVPGAAANDALGRDARTLRLADVTGDGALDLILAAQLAAAGATALVGAAYVWSDVANASGTVNATATLQDTTASADSRTCGFLNGTATLHVIDVTGDGTLDIVCAAPRQDVGGATAQGAIHVWAGGAMAGLVTPTATLTAPGAGDNAAIGAIGVNVTEWVPTIVFADLNGDGSPDVVAPAAPTGSVFVWEGGATLTGTVTHAARLFTPDGAGDGLALVAGQNMIAVDLSGDGIPDLLSGSTLADPGAVADAGELYVWNGGTTLTGGVAVPADVRLRAANAQPDDQLGAVNGAGLQVLDFTGDGTLDVLGAAGLADVNANADVGALFLWSGDAGFSAAMTSSATLSNPGAAPGDELGNR